MTQPPWNEMVRALLADPTWPHVLTDEDNEREEFLVLMKSPLWLAQAVVAMVEQLAETNEYWLRNATQELGIPIDDYNELVKRLEGANPPSRHP